MFKDVKDTAVWKRGIGGFSVIEVPAVIEASRPLLICRKTLNSYWDLKVLLFYYMKQVRKLVYDGSIASAKNGI